MFSEEFDANDAFLTIHAGAGGTDAQGEVTVRLEKGGRITNGQGADTDIVVASAKAYLNAWNKLVEPIKRIGRTLVAVVPEGDQAIAPQADWVLPVVGNVREIFSPMVYAVAGELFSAHLSDVVGEPFFRDFSEAYDVEKYGGNSIRNSQVIERGEL